MTWCVWGPEIHGGRMVVADGITKQEANDIAERKNAAALKHGAKDGYQAVKEGEQPDAL